MNQESIKFLLALRVKHLRNASGLSLKQLSNETGLSPSYLNEIEKAKKLPKMEKLMSLSKALGVDLDQLLSKNVDQKLRPLVNFLESRFFKDFPLEVFGISHYEVYDLMSHDPIKFSTLLSAFNSMIRSYDLNLEDIHYSALRVYQESHKNYFEDIEAIADEVRKKMKVVNEKNIQALLERSFHYHLNKKSLDKIDGLEELRSLFIFEDSKKHLYINEKLLAPQKLFVLGKELGYEVLQLDRPQNKELKLYKDLLNDFKASYFAGALIMSAKDLVKDMKLIFAQQEFRERDFKKLMLKYGASSEVFLNRLTQILPRFFNFDELFFLKLENENTHDNLNNYDITKELHFSKIHAPHGIGLKEHYCRRWITITLLKQLEQKLAKGIYKKPLIGVQVSKMINTNDDYFVVSIARPSRLKKNKNSCLTLGIQINQEFKKKVKFWNSNQIQNREVSQTCERCPKEDCLERAYAPAIVDKIRSKKKLQAGIECLISTHQSSYQ
ncbi:MAG: helix-turn-helix domain-containing protein [Bacteriovoracaceae bacterium]